MRDIIVFLIGFLVVYLLASFIAWDFNPGNWSEPGRVATGLFGVLVGVFCSAAYSRGTYSKESEH